MSQENVEIVRRMYDAFTRKDSAAARSLAHPDVVVTFQRRSSSGIGRSTSDSRIGHAPLIHACQCGSVPVGQIFKIGKLEADHGSGVRLGARPPLPVSRS
jgi:hypothetical protein